MGIFFSKHSINSLIRNKFFVVITISILLLGLLFPQITSTRGSKNKEEIITVYLNALTKQDYATLRKLTLSDFDSREAVQKELKEFGGNKFDNITVNYSESVKSGLWYATIKGVRIETNGERIPFNHLLAIQESNERWYVRFGRQKSSLPSIGEPPLSLYP